MVAKIEKTPQLNMYMTPLSHFIKGDHELILLSQKIDWDTLDKELSVYYCMDNGRPGIPIRKISGIVILKRMFDESDESVLDKWVENPYWQYFCGEVYFQHELPFDRTELIKFRQRIGEQGAERILACSIDLFPAKEIKEKEVLIDTSVQEKNITYPTDTKLQAKIIKRCRKIAKKEGINLRQSYQRVLKQLMIDQRFREHPKRRKKANAAARKIKTIAGRVLRDLERGMDQGQRDKYEELLLIFKQILSQERDTKNKIYSIHEPHVKCIAKGKEAKKYEYGNKVSIAKTKKSGIILGALSFIENVYDGDTLEAQLSQIENVTGGYRPKIGIVDRGFRGRKHVNGTQIVIPTKLPASATNYQKQKLRKQFRARAGIEPIIGHLKQDHRMSRNYLSGNLGDTMNVLLAATGFNMRKMLHRLRKKANNILLQILNRIFSVRKYSLIFS